MLFDWMYPLFNVCLFVNYWEWNYWEWNYETDCPILSFTLTMIVSCALLWLILSRALVYSYPKYTGVLMKALDVWYYDPNITTPILKLMAELVQNKTQVRLMQSCLPCLSPCTDTCNNRCFPPTHMQRLQFDVTSPNGVLLFREASKTITCYGDHILTLTDIADDKLYALKYPPVTNRRISRQML